MHEVNIIRQLHLYNSSHILVSSIHAITDAGIPDALDHGAHSAETLAGQLNVNPDALRRILRFLSGYGIFREDISGAFSHTNLSRLLRSDNSESLRSIVHGSTLAWRIAAALPSTLRSGRPAAGALEPSGLYGYLSSHPEEARAFDQSMASRSASDVGALLRAFDFSRFRLVADIGGGRGTLIQRIMSVYPTLRGVLFDLPRVLDDRLPCSTDRLSIQPGDFFHDSLPVADLYILRNVVHNWEDADALRILKSVRSAGGHGATLLIMETLMPEGPTKDSTGPHPAVVLDIYMLLGVGGRERTRAQYESLLTQVGYRINRMIPTAGNASLLECTLVN